MGIPIRTARPTFYGALAIFRRDLLVFVNDFVADLVTTLSMPLTYVLIFGLGLSPFIRDIEGLPYLAFVVPGLIAMAGIQSAFDDAAWGIWFHRMVQGTIHEYRVNPITTSDIITGKILSGFFKAVVKATLVGAILIPFAAFPFKWAYLPYFVLLLLLGSIFFSCVGNIAGTWIDDAEMLGRFEAIIVIPLIFLSGLFFPISSYPAFIQPLIQAFPAGAIFEGARAALLFGRLDLVSLAVGVVSAVLGFIAAIVLFDRRLAE